MLIGAKELKESMWKLFDFKKENSLKKRKLRKRQKGKKFCMVWKLFKDVLLEVLSKPVSTIAKL